MTGIESAERLLRERRSVRQFADRPVDPALVTRLIEAATWAPSPGNRQNWRFTVVSSPDIRHRMATAARDGWQEALARAGAGAIADELRGYVRNFDWFDAAPVAVAVSAREPDAFMGHLLGERAEAVSGCSAAAAMAAQNLMLAAHAAGLGSCCLTGPLAAEDELRRLLGIEKRHRLVCIVVLGYASGVPPATARKPVADVTRTVT